LHLIHAKNSSTELHEIRSDQAPNLVTNAPIT
jgi:hypothetical protein